MSYQINFYDKDTAPIRLDNEQGDKVKQAIINGKTAIVIGDNLYMTNGIASVQKVSIGMNYKTPDQLGLNSSELEEMPGDGYKKFQEMKAKLL